MSRFFSTLAASAAATLLLASAGNAVAGFTGPASVVTLTPPTSVVEGVNEGNSTLFAIVEQQGVVAPDLVEDGAIGTAPGVSEGDIVNSFFFHFDPVGAPETPATLTSIELTFDQPILGVFTDNTGLDETDAAFGLSPDVLYPTGVDLRGLELDINDIITVAGNVLTVNSITAFRANTDQFRVVTAIPEPGTVAVWGLCGLCGLVAGRRKMRARRS